MTFLSSQSPLRMVSVEQLRLCLVEGTTLFLKFKIWNFCILIRFLYHSNTTAYRKLPLTLLVFDLNILTTYRFRISVPFL